MIFKLAIICGGPSQERGISLNSARSVMDHLKSPQLEIIPLFVDYQKNFYFVSHGQLYSNTPADFDFKLHQTATQLDEISLKALLQTVDLVFPVVHGAFGEDGELQSLLEKFQVPFVGHSSAACKWMFKKHQAAETLQENGFPTLPQLVFSKDSKFNHLPLIERFFGEHQLTRAIVKPTVGGSSIGVSSVATPQEALAKVKEIFTKELCQQALIEPFCEGKEFTVIVFENEKGEPVALIPTEVELNYDHHQIFDYRKKYLPTNQTSYHTPPRFSLTITDLIRMQAEQIFKLFGMRDFVRLDGWLKEDGTLYFTDINPISGLEQNSFFFRQSSVVGMTHRQTFEYILKRACARYQLKSPFQAGDCSKLSKEAVYILFGSYNAERQVSLMSGTNVWLKLLQSEQHAPTPFLYDKQGNIWELPYSFNLNHTVEEIYANCCDPSRASWQPLIDTVCRKLGIAIHREEEPIQQSLENFLKRASQEQAFVFIAMHGGEGENGTLQRHLEAYQIPFNGSNSQASALCMDKYLTGQIIQQLDDPYLQTIPKKCVRLAHYKKGSTLELEKLWEELTRELASRRLIIKPRYDGCSAGIVLLQSAQDFEHYCQLVFQEVPYISPHTFTNQSAPIEMPPHALKAEYLLEPYIETDAIVIEQHQLRHFPKEGWIELTVGVLEKGGKYHAFNPSITVAEGAILSLEEKFQGGTGINLTPPPEEILPSAATKKIKEAIEKAAKALGIQNYARLDIFYNRLTEKVILIEANTLPGLTASTVIYHQGIAEKPSLPPLALLEKMIASKKENIETHRV